MLDFVNIAKYLLIFFHLHTICFAPLIQDPILYVTLTQFSTNYFFHHHYWNCVI